MAEHGADGDLCGAIAGIAEDAGDGGVTPDDYAWFHERLRDLCVHYNVPSVQV